MAVMLAGKASYLSRGLLGICGVSVYCILFLFGLPGNVVHAQAATIVSSNPSPSSSPSPGAGLQLQQLRLQIKELEQQTSLEARLQPYIPLLSVLVALVGAGFGAYKYIHDRQRDYALRVEQEVTVNLGYLVEFPKADSSLNARVATALDNLNWLVDKTEDSTRYRQRVTEAIFVEVRDDIDFDDEKQARFDGLCLARWPAYAQYISEHAELHDFILYRYRQALRVLKEQDPVYFSTIRRTDDGSYHVDRYIKESMYRHFQVLVDGFIEHVNLIPSSERWAKAVDDFADALGNDTLARQLFIKEISVD